MVFARPAVAAALACACWFPGAAVAEAPLIDALPHITVVGHSHIEIVPDFATLSLAVVTEKPQAASAAAANARAAQAVVDEVRAQGIDPRDIQTSEISLTPVYDNVSDALGHPSSQKLRGYQARNGLTVRVHDISKAGALAARLIDSGANEFQGLSFGASHEDEIYARLNDEAMRDALRTAKAYLPASGAKLGQVLEIAPSDQGGIQPRVFARAMALQADYAVPVEPGTLSYDAQVRVTWELVTH